MSTPDTARPRCTGYVEMDDGNRQPCPLRIGHGGPCVPPPAAPPPVGVGPAAGPAHPAHPAHPAPPPHPAPPALPTVVPSRA